MVSDVGGGGGGGGDDDVLFRPVLIPSLEQSSPSYHQVKVTLKKQS